jgi:hypothetical protein
MNHQGTKARRIEEGGIAELGPLDDLAYVIADYTALTGTAFASVSNLSDGFSIDYHHNGSTQIAVVVPEPSTFATFLGGIGALGLLRRRRR